MAQPFSMRLPLVDGHGNFGSLDDGPAALALHRGPAWRRPALLMTGGLDEDIVDFVPNYDDQQRSPACCPAALPQPAGQRRQRHRRRHGHQHAPAQPGRGDRRRPAPDRAPRRDARRPDAVRARPRPADRRQDRRARGHPRRLRDRPRLVPDPGHRPDRERHAPPQGHRRHRAALQVGPEKVIEKIKDLVQAKKLQGIADVKDLTDRTHGLRLVIEIKNGFHPEAVLEQLYRLTPMEDSFGINNVALVDGQPRTLGLQGPAARSTSTTASTSSAAAPRYRLRQARGAAAPRRGPAHRDPRHRRGHPADPRQRRRRRGQGRG